MADDAFRTIGGEFADEGREAAYRLDRLPDALRQARQLFLLIAAFVSLFIVSDWLLPAPARGPTILPGRIALILLALAGVAALARIRTVRALDALLMAWMAATAIAIAVLVSAQGNVALFVAVMAPVIYFLAVPASFRALVAGGALCGALAVVAFVAPGHPPANAAGLIIVMAMLITALVLVVTRSNRLARVAWAATQRERQANTALERSRHRFEAMFDAAPIPFIVSTRAEGHVLHANAAGREFFGVSAEPTLTSIRHLYPEPERLADMLRSLDRNGRVDGFELAVTRADGELRDIMLTAKLVEFGEGPCLITGVVDITERKALETRLARVLTTDTLTGLDNRKEFYRQSERAIQVAAQDGSQLAVLSCSIDDLRSINLVHGAVVGDGLVRGFAALCRDRVVREASLIRNLGRPDLVGRLDGNRFGLLVGARPLADVLRMAEALCHSAAGLDAPGLPRGARVTVSIGVAMVGPADTSIGPALLRASGARRAAQKAGGNRVVTTEASSAAPLAQAGF